MSSHERMRCLIGNESACAFASLAAMNNLSVFSAPPFVTAHTSNPAFSSLL